MILDRSAFPCRSARNALACGVCLFVLALFPATAGATVTIESFDTSVSTTQAGTHPDLDISFSLESSGDPEAVKELDLGLPPGLFLAQFLSENQLCAPEDIEASECGNGSMVGLITIYADYGDSAHLMGTEPVYLLTPRAEEHLRLGFGFPVVKAPVEVPVRLRTGSDYRPDLTLGEFPPSVPVASAQLSLWGVPGDDSHDTHRPLPGECAGITASTAASCFTPPRPPGHRALPFLTNPTRCGVPLQATLALSTHEQPSEVISSTAPAPQTAGCNKLPFGPSLSAGLTTAETGSPSGLNLDLQLPGPEGTEVLVPSAIKALELALPPELVIDPEAAGSLPTCANAQFKLGTDESHECPSESAVGTLSVAIEGLKDQLEGAAYFGTPEPGDTYRLFLAATGSGIDLKLVALLEPGPEEEQVTVVLSGLPQIPIREVELNLGSSAGLLTTPYLCGAYSAAGTFTPWSGGPAAISTHALEIDSVGPDEGPCPGPAAEVGVSLSPAKIAADGTSTSTATATVIDESEVGVFGDEVTFSSTDPGQQIGPVTDNGDGTYTAEITSSTLVGTSTITASDSSVEPEVLGTATLAQVAPIGPPPMNQPPTETPRSLPPDPRPRATIASRPARQTHDRTPTFRFTSSEPGSTFSCKVDKRPFRPCTSPTTLPRLSLGQHAFSVRAIDTAGQSSEPSTWRFNVRSADAADRRPRG